jgi:Tfp pilus assembly protein FimT
MEQQTGERGFSLVDVLAFMAVTAILMAIALPSTSSSTEAFKLKSDAQALNNMVSVAKMRASARFTRARVQVNTATQRYFIETWDRDNDTWVNDGDLNELSDGVSFGWSDVDAPPPDTLPELNFSPACLDDDGAEIENTACITFNSRGVPIDGVGAPTGLNAFFVTDGIGVYATTVTATPLVKFWWSKAQEASWVER